MQPPGASATRCRTCHRPPASTRPRSRGSRPSRSGSAPARARSPSGSTASRFEGDGDAVALRSARRVPPAALRLRRRARGADRTPVGTELAGLEGAVERAGLPDPEPRPAAERIRRLRLRGRPRRLRARTLGARHDPRDGGPMPHEAVHPPLLGQGLRVEEVRLEAAGILLAERLVLGIAREGAQQLLRRRRLLLLVAARRGAPRGARDAGAGEDVECPLLERDGRRDRRDAQLRLPAAPRLLLLRDRDVVALDDEERARGERPLRPDRVRLAGPQLRTRELDRDGPVPRVELRRGQPEAGALALGAREEPLHALLARAGGGAGGGAGEGDAEDEGHGEGDAGKGGGHVTSGGPILARPARGGGGFARGWRARRC